MSPRVGLDLSTILQAATEIADREGYDAVTLATLAKKLAIRPPSLYNHVDGLNGLRKMMAIHGLLKLHSCMTDQVIGLSGNNAVHALGEAYVGFVKIHPGLYKATFRAPDPHDTEIQQAGSKIVDLAIRVLSAYGLEDEAAIHAVRGLRSLFHGFASLEQSGGFGLPVDLDVSRRVVIDSFLSGIDTIRKSKWKSDN